MSDAAKWYVVHTYSGYENKVASSIEKAVENRRLHDLITAVNIPTEKVVEVKDGKAEATIIWSSSNYDYMRVDEEKFLPVNTEGNSTFVITVTGFDSPLTVYADTTAMSTPHEIEYTLTFDSSTLEEQKQ